MLINIVFFFATCTTNWILTNELCVCVYFGCVRECYDSRLLSRISALANIFKTYLCAKINVCEIKWYYSTLILSAMKPWCLRDGTDTVRHCIILFPNRIPFEESLLNSTNHVDYDWTDEIYMCGCAEQSDDIPDRTYSVQTNTYERYYEYKGGLKCSSDVPCTTRHQGISKPVAHCFLNLYVFTPATTVMHLHI